MRVKSVILGADPPRATVAQVVPFVPSPTGTKRVVSKKKKRMTSRDLLRDQS